jgi:hypothetical protein
VGKLVARLLREAGVGRLAVASRNAARAGEVAAAVRGRPLRASDVPAALTDADLLVTATGAAIPVVLAEQVRAARAQGGRAPQDSPSGVSRIGGQAETQAPSYCTTAKPCKQGRRHYPHPPCRLWRRSCAVLSGMHSHCLRRPG